MPSVERLHALVPPRGPAKMNSADASASVRDDHDAGDGVAGRRRDVPQEVPGAGAADGHAGDVRPQRPADRRLPVGVVTRSSRSVSAIQPGERSATDRGSSQGGTQSPGSGAGSDSSTLSTTAGSGTDSVAIRLGVGGVTGCTFVPYRLRRSASRRPPSSDPADFGPPPTSDPRRLPPTGARRGGRRWRVRPWRRPGPDALAGSRSGRGGSSRPDVPRRRRRTRGCRPSRP